MKNIVFFVVCLLATLTSSAQGNYQFSFIASPQFSWMKSDSDILDSDGTRVGYAFGILSDRFIDNEQRYSLHSGFLIASTGGKLKEVQTSGSTELKYKITNIEVPLSIKLRTAQFSRNTYFVQLGLTNWFRISDDVETNMADSDYNGVNFYNIGYNVGGGMEFDIGGENALTFGLVYQNGFLDVTDNKYINDEMKLNNIRVQFGLIF